jgi:hypothetical protein
MSAVAETVELKKFLSELNEDIATRCDAESSSTDAMAPHVALAEVMLEFLEEEGVTTEAQLCPFADVTGRRRCSITGYSFGEDGDRLDLFQAWHSADPNGGTLSASDLSQLAGKAARFFDYAVKADWNRFSGLPEVLDAVRLIHAGLKQLTSVRIFILTNAIEAAKSTRRRSKPSL